MFGVVLWSDPNQNRAVIWCEDHGELAFLKGDEPDAAPSPELDPGDLVQFDMHQDRYIRLASNVKLVASVEYPTLARDLTRANDSAGKLAPEINAAAKQTVEAKIIAFKPKPEMHRHRKQQAQQAI